ncbi:prepilin-type cleavage/methylation domain-containing protein [Aliidiomarina iranensis]|uniref:Prepilin-type cleavage/methylation domain-containing protein n=1 Tax=Aliidiomarina iranensis TaxID=1434071 RepID=A0A432VWF8_9GAMM|nr:prepilin-type N-terminal cleavage/methylation domain-containing protein [Aliidiomarina iranensis]RUO20939.1 prepilin-type cleavage/methylation domain-containing protein [Aliidiomarina iranensis]
MGRARGFSLIELIIVIIILAVVGVTAAPRFFNLSTDANRALLEELAGASKSAANLVYAKALIQGEAGKVLGTVDLDGDGVSDIETVYGYPTGDRIKGLPNALSLEEDWRYGNTFGGTQLFFSPARIIGSSGPTNNNIPLLRPDCYLAYRPPTNPGDAPTYTFFDSGC